MNTGKRKLLLQIAITILPYEYIESNVGSILC